MLQRQKGLRKERWLIGILCGLLLLGFSLVVDTTQLNAAGIEQKGYTTAANGGQDESRLLMTKPAGTAAGDLMLAQVTFEKGNDIQILVAPQGWQTVIRTDRDEDIAQVIYYKVAGVDEPGTYEWQFKESESSYEEVRAAGSIISYTGVDGRNPIMASSGNRGDAGLLSAPSVNATVGAHLVALYGYKKQVILTQEAQMVKTYQKQHANQSGPTVMAAEEVWDRVGNTGGRNAVFSPPDQTEKWVAQLIALRPADAGGVDVGTVPGATTGITVYIGGQALVMDQPPMLQEGRTLVPMRALFEALGATVEWNAGRQTVTAMKQGILVEIVIGSTLPVVNGIAVPIDVPAQIYGSRTYVPLRFIGEALGNTVFYDPATRRIDITP